MRKSGFTEKKFNRLLIASLLGWVVSIIGNLADGILAGAFVSEAAVAAVELVAPVFSILLFLCVFIAAGGSTLYSRAAGAFDMEKSRKIAGMCVVCSLAVGAGLALLMYFGEDAYFAFYTSSAEVDALAREYFHVYIIIAAIYPIYWSIYYLVNCDGDDGLVLAVDAISALGNAAGSLIFVTFMGVKGLAVGTVVSLIVSAIPLVFHFFKPSNSIHFKLWFSFDTFKQMFALGSTTSLGSLYLGVVDILMNKIIIMNFGDNVLPAYTIVNLVLNMAMALCCAPNAALPFISVYRGEENPLETKKIMKMTIKSSIIIGILMTVAMEACAGLTPAMYNISDPIVSKYMIDAVRVISLSYLVTSFFYVESQYYISSDDILIGNIGCAIYNLIGPVVLVLPLIKLFGFEGLIWGFFFTPFAAIIYYFFAMWKKYGIKSVPFHYQEVNHKIFTHDLSVDEEGIIAARNKVAGDLQSCGISEEVANKVELMVEEAFMIVKEHNKKTVDAVCTIMVYDNAVRLITRDNGKVFDITQINSELKSLRHYVAARLMETNKENAYLTTISFNRNSFMWEF